MLDRILDAFVCSLLPPITILPDVGVWHPVKRTHRYEMNVSI